MHWLNPRFIQQCDSALLSHLDLPGWFDCCFHRIIHRMGKTEFAKQVDEIQSQLVPFLKENGFRKRGRTFNRTSADGLISVINFQMGAFDPPGTSAIPGLRKSLYGSFTINLGIFVPEVYRYQSGSEAISFVQHDHCCIRARLGSLGPERQDIWWQAKISSKLVEELRNRLVSDALPFLKRFESREAIIRDWPDYYDEYQFGSSSSPNIVLAIILANQGRTEEARPFLEQQIRQSQHESHKAYVRSLAIRLGLEQLGT